MRSLEVILCYSCTLDIFDGSTHLKCVLVRYSRACTDMCIYLIGRLTLAEEAFCLVNRWRRRSSSNNVEEVEVLIMLRLSTLGIYIAGKLSQSMQQGILLSACLPTESMVESFAAVVTWDQVQEAKSVGAEWDGATTQSQTLRDLPDATLRRSRAAESPPDAGSHINRVSL